MTRSNTIVGSPCPAKIGTARALQDGDEPSTLTGVGRDHGHKT
jgi:hypothetical protein